MVSYTYHYCDGAFASTTLTVASSDATVADYTCSGTDSFMQLTEQQWFYVTKLQDDCYREEKERAEREEAQYWLEFDRERWREVRQNFEEKEKVKASACAKIHVVLKDNVKRLHNRENLGLMNYKRRIS